jgi:hypothetical protein
MPPINHVAVSAGIAAVTVAVAAAMALYENEDVRRYADQIRRRLAIVLHNLGNELDPGQTGDLEPLFNRPEDAEGFLMSSRGALEPAVDADEESRKRQREELMYWNALRESKLESEKSATEPPASTRPRGVSFDDFLKPDESGETGTFVINSGSDANNRDGLVRRNVVGATEAGYTNPFSDEQEIHDERLAVSMLAPSVDEMSDIYSATTADLADEKKYAGVPASPRPVEESAALIDFASDDGSESTISGTMEESTAGERLQRSGFDEPADPRFGERASMLFSDISAWAEAANQTSRPASPASSFTNADLSDGQLTPDDGMSIASADVRSEPGVDEGVGGAYQNTSDVESNHYDVRSVSEGMFTPASWSEVGSTVSEDDIPVPVRQ